MQCIIKCQRGPSRVRNIIIVVFTNILIQSELFIIVRFQPEAMCIYSIHILCDQFNLLRIFRFPMLH